MVDIRKWLEGLGLDQYAEAFEANEVTLDQAPDLTHEVLKELGVTAIGHRMTLIKAARAFSDGDAGERSADNQPPSKAWPAKPIVRDAERRQLTVMFCDLVGSTALFGQIDPEDMRDVIRDYQNAVAGEVARFDGFVAKFMGDGILAYFGWPVAHEDDGERAVRAGLSIMGVMGHIRTPQGNALAARIGIATGLVVVGDLVGEGASQEHAVLGETPNLAARLQALAEPGQVVIAEATKRLLGAVFDLDELAPQTIKGLSEPVVAFAVSGERVLGSRFEARAGQTLLPMVGRDQELALLLERWHQAKAGDGQGALLVGEAGIGKSRIARALIDELAPHEHIRIRYQCSPFHTDSAMWPVIQQLTLAAGIAGNDANEAKLDKVEALLKQGRDDVSDAAPLIAELLSIDGQTRYGRRDLTPQALRTRTLRALTDQLLCLAAMRPVLLVLEDAHWIDPTTHELIEQFLDHVDQAQVLILLTSRPDNQPDLAAHPRVTRLALNRLSRARVEEIVSRLRGNRELPVEVIDAIILRTDGVPLFIEELTKAILETGETTIPASLHDTLMARLDRIPEVKEVAQMAACIGREFDFALLAAVADKPRQELVSSLERLAAAGLVYRRGVPPEAHYTFNHALVRDAAYESLLRRTRQHYHHQVAQTLKECFPEQAETEPEVLAFHYTGAERTGEAIDYWLLAGKRAIEQSANAEAIAHLSKGLELLQELPDGANRARQELSLRIDLVACMRILDRYDEALATLDLAQKIATNLGRTEDLALIHNYRGNIYFPLGKFEKCLEQHQLAAGYAQEAEAVEQEARALSGLGDASYSQGRMITAYDYYQRCVHFCRKHALHRIEGDNLFMVAWSRHFLNDIAGAAKAAIAAIEATLASGHRRAEILARWAVASMLLDLGDIAGARTQIEAGQAIVETIGALRFKPLYAIVQNRVGLAEGRSRPQLAAAMEEAFRISRETGITYVGPWVLSSLALATDDPDRRRQALADGEALLRAGCVGHNHLKFYPDAIEIALDDATWDEVERYCAALADYTRPEPLPSTDFYVAYGHVLAAFGRGLRDDATLNEIEHLRNEATRAGLIRPIPRLEQALAEASFATGSPA